MEKIVTYAADSTDSGSYPNEKYALPFMVSNEISQEAYKKLGKDTTNHHPNGNYEIVSEHNIGYLTGSSNSAKINGKQIKNAINSDSITKKNNKITDFKIYTSKSNRQGDKHLVTDLDSNIKAKMLDILNDPSGIIKGFRLSAQVDQNNTIQDFLINDEKVILPSKALWFVPKEDGIIKIVIDTWNGAAKGFSLYQIIRGTNQNNQSENTNPFANSISSTSVIQKVYRDENEKLYYNTAPQTGVPPVYDCAWTRELDEKELYYFEIPVEGGKEYALGNQNGSGPFLVYLDLGQNAGSSSKSGEIHDCDFVKTGTDGKTLIKIRNDTNYNPNYTESGVLISFVAPTSTLIIFFNRIDKEGEDIVIYLVNQANSLTIDPNVGKKKANLSTDTTEFTS